MNELPPPANSIPVSASAETTTASSESSRFAVSQWRTIVLIVLALLLAAQWLNTRSQIRSLRTELAQRLQSGDNTNSETRMLAKAAQESSKELQGKISVLENRQVEAQSQQLALEQLYQELSRNRDDWALAEIEQVLSTASQQLQLAGNVPGALIALQNADRSLSRSDKPQFITIRRAIARDQERLKALPQLDVNGIAVRLDSVIGQIDSMPLLSDEKPAQVAAQPKNARPVKTEPGAKKALEASWSASLKDKWDSWSSEMAQDLRQLVRVRQVDTPEALLLSPTQAYYARENLKLRLLNARLGLLSRNESAFRSDLIAAQDTIARYFDTRAKQTQTAQTLLKQVQNSNLSIELPTLSDSLNAVRNYKAKP
ncbi:MAG: uroporphyrinogen-III C-methyltransferase [Proteobacteria bacterium]|nr:uroporphyrinogen-III C-methyltransferase [Pseudomonadota bacterium]